MKPPNKLGYKQKIIDFNRNWSIGSNSLNIKSWIWWRSINYFCKSSILKVLKFWPKILAEIFRHAIFLVLITSHTAQDLKAKIFQKLYV